MSQMKFCTVFVRDVFIQLLQIIFFNPIPVSCYLSKTQYKKDEDINPPYKNSLSSIVEHSLKKNYILFKSKIHLVTLTLLSTEPPPSPLYTRYVGVRGNIC